MPGTQKPDPIPPELDAASKVIIGSAIEVHRHLGPGFLESIYRKALVHEMRLQRLTVNEEVPISVIYKDLRIDGQRLDLIVQPGVVIELKTVEKLLRIHEAQLLSYLRTTGHRLGLLINFNEKIVTDGIKRLAL
jgi:GxxExxY protein